MNMKWLFASTTSGIGSWNEKIEGCTLTNNTFYFYMPTLHFNQIFTNGGGLDKYIPMGSVESTLKKTIDTFLAKNAGLYG